MYCAVFGICLIAALYVCGSKNGFHEDEYYTYYSSNRTQGFWIEDGVPMDRQTILDEFTVVPGEGYNFGLVKEVQSWDVHPPVYYFLVHLVCSFSPGVFSMWQGLIINLICYLLHPHCASREDRHCRKNRFFRCVWHSYGESVQQL